ncbi:hypothetical protein L195_g021518 [Trifolium pratense]|uniref:Uncharacterized protein n=1 Tax=Trifolium pratense TaxID=57577 RepID=A0A2K3N5H6_TRIPR|nr:hypothetical protein L195_g021518 [Trifolium pratense]
MSEEDKAGLKKLEDWVAGFVKGPCVHRVKDEDGNTITVPLLGEDGKQVFEIRCIQTNELLSCKSGATRLIVLDNMSGQAANILKMFSKNKKKSVNRQGSAMSSATGASSGSPQIGGTSVVREKRQRTEPMEDDLVMLDIEQKGKTVVPPCWGQPKYFEKHPLSVGNKEKIVVLGMEPKKREEAIAEDVAGLMRLVETALVLNERAGVPDKDLEAARARVRELEVVNMALEGQLEKEVEGLRPSGEQLKQLEEEVAKLRQDMAPAEGEIEFTRGFKTRAELVQGCSKVLDQLTREVRDGQIILDEENEANELADLEAEKKKKDGDDMAVEQVDDTQERQDESG